MKKTSLNSSSLAWASFLFVLISLVAVVFQFETLQNHCVCISNFLAWAWIAFAFTFLFGLIQPLLKSSVHRLIVYLLQALLFFFGLSMSVLFGARLLDVI